MTTVTKIQSLATEMNVSIRDLMCFANCMAEMIKKDKGAEAFLSGDEQTRTELTQAYAVPVFRKFDQFHATYSAIPEARKAFIQSISSMIKR